MLLQESSNSLKVHGTKSINNKNNANLYINKRSKYYNSLNITKIHMVAMWNKGECFFAW